VRPTRSPLLSVAVFALSLTAAALPARAQLLSPGPLSRVHAALEGDSKCESCHQAGRRVVDERCTDCHTSIAAQRTQGTGLHGKQWPRQACGDCHIDHLGRDVSLVRWPGGDMRRFDHVKTGFRLDNAHAEATCVDCHEKRTKSGTQTFLGQSPRCASCHEDPHKGRLGQDCASCHGTKSFVVAQFDHGLTRFPLRGKHQTAECSSCHGTPRRFEGLTFDDCDSCHKTPHDSSFGACSSCHVEDGFELHELGNRGIAQMRKGHPGVPLANGHATVSCRSCHTGALDEAPAKGAACVDCHAPVHDADFGSRCEKCHTQVRWLGLPDVLGYRMHRLTDFPLLGKHEAVACESCHLESKLAQRYRGLAHDRCLDCHSDPHRGQLSEHEGGECGACHSASGFSPSSFGLAQHAATGFALDGQHLAAPCGACHGRTRPRLSFHIEASDCRNCHENPHGQRVDRELAAGGCAHCHTTQGWSFPRIDHASWPLEGVHREVACERCHAPGDDARYGGGAIDFARFGDAPRQCSGCHDDPHAAQFASSDPVRTCDACHDATTFRVYGFPHDALTRFALTGAHAKTPCGDCHRVETLRNDLSAVRYRLGYTQCADCHADPHRSGGGP